MGELLTAGGTGALKCRSCVSGCQNCPVGIGACDGLRVVGVGKAKCKLAAHGYVGADWYDGRIVFVEGGNEKWEEGGGARGRRGWEGAMKRYVHTHTHTSMAQRVLCRPFTAPSLHSLWLTLASLAQGCRTAVHAAVL